MNLGEWVGGGCGPSLLLCLPALTQGGWVVGLNIATACLMPWVGIPFLPDLPPFLGGANSGLERWRPK